MNRVMTLVLSLLLMTAPLATIRAQEDEEINDEIEFAEPAGGEMMGPHGKEMRRRMMRKRLGGERSWRKEREEIEREGPEHRKLKYRKRMIKKRLAKRVKSVEAETLEVIKKNDIDFFRTLKRLRAKNPRQYRFLIKSSAHLLKGARFSDDPSLEKDVVEGVKLEYETRILANKYKKSPKPERDSIRKKLFGKVSKLFELREKGRKAKIQMMEKHLKEMRKKLSDRRAHKKEIVKDRVNELIGEGYRW